MPRLSLVSLTALALVTAGCDRQSEEAAQPEAAAEAGGEHLTGTIDRSFAGQALPTVTLNDPSGATLATADLKGTPVLLNLWATWCVPCVTEMPMLDELAGELGESVRVVTVSQDMNGAEVVGPFFAERKFEHLPQWLDPKNALAVAYGGGSGLPLTVLLDAEGKEVWRVAGGYDWSTAEAREAVAEASKT
jgi:thiol-disulfide isomerase/thioredoxin